MDADGNAAKLITMSEETPGQTIARRRKNEGLSGRQLAKLAKMDPDTLRKAEADDPSTTELTYSRAFKALDDFAHETSSEADEVGDSHYGDEHLVEFRVSGNFGVDVVVKGPVSDMQALQEAVAEIIRNVRSGDPS